MKNIWEKLWDKILNYNNRKLHLIYNIALFLTNNEILFGKEVQKTITNYIKIIL
jgi:hypothetical protein